MLNFHFQSIVDRIWFRNLFHSQQHDCLFSPQMSLSLLSLCQSCRSLGSDSSPFFPRRRVHYSTCLLPLKQLLLVLQVPSLSSLPPLRGWGARTPCSDPTMCSTSWAAECSAPTVAALVAGIPSTPNSRPCSPDSGRLSSYHWESQLANAIQSIHPNT